MQSDFDKNKWLVRKNCRIRLKSSKFLIPCISKKSLGKVVTQLLKPNAFPTLLLLLQNPNENKFRNTFTFKRALVVATVTLLPSLSQQSKQNRIYSDYVVLSKRGVRLSAVMARPDSVHALYNMYTFKLWTSERSERLNRIPAVQSVLQKEKKVKKNPVNVRGVKRGQK